MYKMIYDENNGLWYELNGDFYIPCITIPKEKQKLIGLCGKRHAYYLKEYKEDVYLDLLVNGKLNSYLVEIDKQAEDMYFRLVKEYDDKQGVNEELKKMDSMRWIGLMNNIKTCVREVVDANLIYN